MTDNLTSLRHLGRYRVVQKLTRSLELYLLDDNWAALIRIIISAPTSAVDICQPFGEYKDTGVVLPCYHSQQLRFNIIYN